MVVTNQCCFCGPVYNTRASAAKHGAMACKNGRCIVDKGFLKDFDGFKLGLIENFEDPIRLYILQCRGPRGEKCWACGSSTEWTRKRSIPPKRESFARNARRPSNISRG